MSISKESVSNSILVFLPLFIAGLASMMTAANRAMHLLRAALGFVATGSEQRCESRGWIVGVLIAREEVVLVDRQLVSEEVADKELLAASKFRLSGEQVVRKRS